MQHRIRNLTLTILAALAFSPGLFAQTARPSAGTTAQPDLSGIWQEEPMPGVPAGVFTKEEPPMLPSAIEKSRIRSRGTRQEVEENLLHHATALPPQDAEQVLEDYATLLTLARPEIVPLPDAEAVIQARPLIRHAADVPVLLSAMQSHPDWLLTHNTAHFTPAVAARAGLQIATPRAFFQALARGLR